MSSIHRNAERPAPDRLLTDIADYVLEFRADGAEARRIARYCLMDTLGCGILALGFPACTKLLGPVVPGADLAGGARVPGTRAPPSSVAPGTTGPSSFVQAGKPSASMPQPSVSMRQ